MEILKNRKWAPYLGRRVLIKKNLTYLGSITEVTVLEVSPSGRVKFRWENSGTYSWEDEEEYSFLEILHDKEEQ